MYIIDLNREYEDLYLVCLMEWHKPVVEVKEIKRNWYNKMKDRGLRVKIAFTDENIPGGMIEYMPVEYFPVKGSDIYVISCICIHGYEGKGRGNLRGKGLGKALLKAAEEDVKAMGKKGLAAWGLSGEDCMDLPWFEKQGYVKADEHGGRYLVWKSFSEDASLPKWIEGEFKQEQVEGKVKVTSFFSGECSSQNGAHYRAKKAASDYGDRVIFEEIDLSYEENRKKYGFGGGIYINGEDIFDISVPPPSYDAIRKKIEEKLSAQRIL